MRVIFIASEGVPYSKTGGLADVVGSLPKALAATGMDVQVILPRYRVTKPGKPIEGCRSLTVPLSSGFKFASIQDGGVQHDVQFYLVEEPEFFDREGLYQQHGVDYPDNALRFATFCLAAIEFIKRSATPPDIIHCHDWQAALVPVYLRNLYPEDPFFAHTSVIFTIHNLGYPGLFPPHVLPQISLHAGLFTIDGLEFYGKVNLMKGGILYSDFITTVSHKYAQEMQTPEFGYGMEGVLATRSDKLQGILNGVDYEAWDPAADKLIPATYTPEDLSGKLVCKQGLLEKMGAKEPHLDWPVLGIVSRFAAQKGFDLIAGIVEELMQIHLYVVALGTGDTLFEDLFQRMAAKYPDRFFVRVAYDNTLAHGIEAGSDMFLMPSRYEPSGLNQMYSLKYGTVPIVRATGGLDDTVEPFDGKAGTGFKFQEYNSDALLTVIREAVAIYQDPKTWQKLMHNGMKKDFSWANSARQYAKIYQSLSKSGHKAGAARESGHS